MTKKVFLKLLPLLVLYFLIFMVFAKTSVDHRDEPRYAAYAENLTRGFYAPSDTLLLWNGPGYPLLLAPFAFFDIPWIYAKMLNPVFVFLAVCLLHTTIRNYTSARAALFFSYLFGLYPPFLVELWFLMTEPFALMLVSAFALLVTKWLSTAKLRFIFWAALICAILALTKVFFGYVISAVLLLTLIFARWSPLCRKMAPVYAVSLLLCTPYLFYTYRLTGKFFYWANSGGINVYWMYNPHPNEFGDHRSGSEVMTCDQLAHHRPLYDEISKLNFVERDELFKKQAIKNIVSNPPKMLLNWVSNLSRLWLNFPYSYKYQHPRTLLYMVPNALFLGVVLLCIYPLIKLRRHLPPTVIHAIGLFSIYVAGHSLLYMTARYLCPITPFIFIIIVYTATNLIKVESQFKEEV